MTPSPGEDSIELSDTVGHWAESDLNRALLEGIIQGYPDGTFKPNKEVSRSEFIVMLFNVMNWDEPEEELTFTDSHKVGE